jgi:dipeptidase D
VARIPATKGFEKLPLLSLQAHSDMVTIKKDGSHHNFAKDPIRLVFKKNIVTAVDTTLGADNGIGIALILAMFTDKSTTHGPLEAIITSKEEIGLLGAKELNPKLIKGEYLINLDSELDDEIVIACSGSLTIDSYTKLQLIRNHYDNHFCLSIKDLLGGHSGMDIAKKRLNALKGIFFVMKEMSQTITLVINDISGGTVLNAIPSFATVKFSTNDRMHNIKPIINKCYKQLKKLNPNEKHFRLSLTPIKKPTYAVDKKQSNQIINFLNDVFNGVKIYNQKYQLAQAASNLGKAFIKNKRLYISFNARALNIKDNEQIKDLICKRLKQIRAEYTFRIGQGWNPDIEVSNFTIKFKDYVKRHFKKNLKLTYVLAGLETKDLLSGKFNFKSGISYGVNITSPHSIQETLSISSVDFVYKILADSYLMFPAQ